MFDRNPKATPADVFVAGKTTEQVVRAIHDAMTQTGGATVIVPGVSPLDALAALVARFDRKAAAREAKAA